MAVKIHRILATGCRLVYNAWAPKSSGDGVHCTHTFNSFARKHAKTREWITKWRKWNGDRFGRLRESAWKISSRCEFWSKKIFAFPRHLQSTRTEEILLRFKPNSPGQSRLPSGLWFVNWLRCKMDPKKWFGIHLTTKIFWNFFAKKYSKNWIFNAFLLWINVSMLRPFACRYNINMDGSKNWIKDKIIIFIWGINIFFWWFGEFGSN